MENAGQPKEATPLILFPADSLERSQPERDFQQEVIAAQAAGFTTAIFDFNGLTRGEAIDRVLRRLPDIDEPQTVIYRGWMLRPEQYEILYTGLHERNWILINNPIQYRHCHSLPEAYSCLQGQTPQTVWLTKDEFEDEGSINFDAIHTRLEIFGNKPIVVKDYVKSQKHRWREACFIPSAADRQAVEQVTSNFLKLQGDMLYGGLVYREYVPLRHMGNHSKSGMPLTAEWRLFMLDSKPLLTAGYWDELEYGKIPFSATDIASVADCLQSRLVTVDVAEQEAGGWIVIETGDGQVSGLPTPELAREFYLALAAGFS